jgi:hypothetical protein
MAHVRSHPPDEDHLWRDARLRRARSACLLSKLPVLPFDRDQRRSMARWYQAVRYRAPVHMPGLRQEGRRDVRPLFEDSRYRVRHHATVAGNRGSSSIWRAIDGSRTLSERGRVRGPDQDRVLFVRPHAIRTYRVRIEHAQIRDDVFLVVNSQQRIGGRGIGDI